MLVSITSTSPNAGDLSFLLHKHPDRVRSVDLTVGRAHVFYPESTPERCTATLMVEVDPVRLSRSKRGSAQKANLQPYVNDRPYVASSMLSAAIGKLYGTAMSGTLESRPELTQTALDLEIEVPVVPARGGVEAVERLFQPLGWEVSCEVLPLDPEFESWGDSRYVSLRLVGSATVKAALSHLYVLLPVLDGDKHYWVGEEEIDKLLRRGGDWLPTHPEREFITRRYLRYGDLSRQAMSRLNKGIVEPDGDIDAETETAARHIRNDDSESQLERPLTLNEQRLDVVMRAVRDVGGGSVVDLGCGEGRLVKRLMEEPQVSKVLGIDVSMKALSLATRRLNLDELSERRRERVTLAQGALTYTDARLSGFDVAAAIEVIEHIDIERLDVFARVIFGEARPTAVLVTTPNREYNVHFEGLAPGAFRHADHRFEWTRDEFASWAESVCTEYGYSAEFRSIGPDDPMTGPPTQMAIFRKKAE